MRKKQSKICSKCVLTTNLPNVTIGEDGLCSECHGYLQNKKNNNGHDHDNELYTNKMKKIFTKVKKNKNQYDILVGFSGGKDSSYLLYLLKNKYKLRPLAVSIMNPLVNESASINMEKVTNKLEIDLIKFSINENLFKKYIRNGLIEAKKIKLGPHAACKLCNYLKDAVLNNITQKMGIPLFAYGADNFQFPQPIILEGVEKKDLYKHHIKPLNQIFNKVFSDQYKNTIYNITEEQFCEKNSPVVIYPFTFLKEYSPLKALNMMEKLGINKSEMAPQRTNCSAIHLFNYLSYKNYNSHGSIFTIANTVRKLSFENEKEGKKRREEIINYYLAYKKLMQYLLKLNPDIIIDDQKTKKLLKMFPEFKELKYENFVLTVNAMSKIKYYAKYFDIKL
jgi:hypothetical protein